MPFYQTFNKNFKGEEEVREACKLYYNLREELKSLGIQNYEKDFYNLKTKKESHDASFSVILPTTPIANAYLSCENTSFKKKSGRILLGVKHFDKNQEFSDIEKIALEHNLIPSKTFESK